MVCEHNIGKDISDYYQVKGNLDELIENARMGTKWVVQECLAPTKPLSQMTIGEQDKVKKKIRDFILEISPFTDEIDITDIVLSLSAFFDKSWLNETKRIGKKGMNEMEVCDAVLAQHKLMYNEKAGFFEYTKNGIWEEKDDTVIMSYITNVYGRLSTGSKITTGLKQLKSRQEIYSEIPLKIFNTLPLVTFQNGTLHIDLKFGTVILKPHSETDYTTVKLPYRYDPNATCKKWRKFINDVTNGNEKDQKVLQEFTGYIFLPDCRFQKALMLIGTGSNGKSVFTNILSKMLGGSNGYVSYVEPSKLSKDFRLMPFKDSLLNISSDSDADLRGAEAEFKKIVAGENLEDAYKFKKPFSFPTRSKMVMNCNYFPTINDTSEGFMRRFLIVDFPMHFVAANKVVPNTNKRPLNINLEQELLEELPGIFNWAIEGLQRLLAQGYFTESDQQEERINKFIRESNPLMSFAESNEEIFFEEKDTVKEGKKVSKRKVSQAYRHWAEQENEFLMCGRKLHAIFARLGWEFTEEKNSWTFKDIKLAEPEYDDDEEKDVGYTQDADEQMAELVAGN